MRIEYESQKISFGGVGNTHSVKYINLDSALGLRFTPVTDNANQKKLGNINYLNNELRYYNGTAWVVLRDIKDKLSTTIDKRSAPDIGSGDFRSSLDAGYPLPSFHASVVDSSGYYRPNTITNTYLTTVGTTPTWKKWSSNKWNNGGDPNGIWGGYINFKIPYINWGGNLLFKGTVKFSYGWNIGFADNALRVYNVRDPVAAGDAVNKRYAVAATETIYSQTYPVIFAPVPAIEAKAKELQKLYDDAVKNLTTKPNQMKVMQNLARGYV